MLTEALNVATQCLDAAGIREQPLLQGELKVFKLLHAEMNMFRLASGSCASRTYRFLIQNTLARLQIRCIAADFSGQSFILPCTVQFWLRQCPIIVYGVISQTCSKHANSKHHRWSPHDAV